jgi:hypothetical protein
MARIRTVKPEFWASEQVAACSMQARLLFIGLWTFSDDAGRHPASPGRLKMQVFPADDCSSDDVARWMAELIDQGLVHEYEVDRKRYWAVTGWRHQRIEKPTVRHPAPPDSHEFDDQSSTYQQPVAEPSTNGRRGNGESLPTGLSVVGEPSPPECKGSGEDCSGSGREFDQKCAHDPGNEAARTFSAAPIEAGHVRDLIVKALGSPKTHADHEWVRKVAILEQAGSIAENELADFCEADKRCRPVNHYAYAQTVLTEKLAGRGVDLNSLLAAADIPTDDHPLGNGPLEVDWHAAIAIAKKLRDAGGLKAIESREREILAQAAALVAMGKIPERDAIATVRVVSAKPSADFCGGLETELRALLSVGEHDRLWDRVRVPANLVRPEARVRR